MREHSGAEGKNNNRDPTLRDHERAGGRSGEAIRGEAKKGTTGQRQSVRKSSP